MPPLQFVQGLCAAGFGGRKTDEESGSAVDLCFCPDAGAVTLKDAMHTGQADAGAFELLLVVETVEDAEKLVVVLHVKAGPVVPDKDNILSSLPDVTDLDLRGGSMGAVFDGVRYQVCEYAAQHARIASHRGEGAPAPVDDGGFHLGLEVSQNLVDERVESH